MERGAAVKQQPDLMDTMGRQTGPLVKETHNQAGEEEGRGLQGSGLRAMGRLGRQGAGAGAPVPRYRASRREVAPAQTSALRQKALFSEPETPRREGNCWR